MAKFDISFERAIAFEFKKGSHGWENVSGDRGGETLFGISRRWHPNFPGWAIVDEMRQRPDFPRNLTSRPELWSMTQEFYRDAFWSGLRGDGINSQAIADELYECATNQGPRYAVEHLQNALATLGYEVEVDGSLGPGTLGALNRAVSDGAEKTILRIQNILQGERYISIIRNDPSQRKFVGWFSRV